MRDRDIIRSVQRLAAFTTIPDGGNPAGVWIGDRLPDPDVMQATAAEVGYSETVFAAPAAGSTRTVRYYSPLAEVPFCGHATIALGVALGVASTESPDNAESTYQLATLVGIVPVSVSAGRGSLVAALTSVAPSHSPASSSAVAQALDLLGWQGVSLDPEIPPAIAYAGAHHLVLAVSERETLRRLEYPFEDLKQFMLAHELTTLQLIWKESAAVFHARNPFPVGGVIEDPATGAAAAALAGYLRALGLVPTPPELTIHQGVDMGRPSRLEVAVPDDGGIIVRGHAVPIPRVDESRPRS